MNVSGIPTFMNNLPKQTLINVSRYVKKLEGREITPERVEEPLTEEQALLRKIFREIWRNGPLVDQSVPLKPMSLSAGKESMTASAQESLSDTMRNQINRQFVENHQIQMTRLASVITQIEVLRSSGFEFPEMKNQ